jgi:hypothetical protein
MSTSSACPLDLDGPSGPTISDASRRMSTSACERTGAGVATESNLRHLHPAGQPIARTLV